MYVCRCVLSAKRTYACTFGSNHFNGHTYMRLTHVFFVPNSSTSAWLRSICCGLKWVTVIVRRKLINSNWLIFSVISLFAVRFNPIVFGNFFYAITSFAWFFFICVDILLQLQLHFNFANITYFSHRLSLFLYLLFIYFLYCFRFISGANARFSCETTLSHM